MDKKKLNDKELLNKVISFYCNNPSVLLDDEKPISLNHILKNNTTDKNIVKPPPKKKNKRKNNNKKEIRRLKHYEKRN